MAKLFAKKHKYEIKPNQVIIYYIGKITSDDSKVDFKFRNYSLTVSEMLLLEYSADFQHVLVYQDV